jgi:4a-hydroxytetrahydrobiopterin dehydratase
MKKLDIEQAEPIRKKFAPDWEIRKGTYLYKKVAFNDYNQVLRFLMAIEQPQIKLDHFADFMNFYNELTIAITTHDVGGLTQLDFELALYIDKALEQMDARQLEENFADGKKNEATSPQMDPKAVEFEMLSDAEKRRLAGEYEKLGPELAIRTWGAALAHAVANYLGGQYLSQLELMLVKKGIEKVATENFDNVSKIDIENALNHMAQIAVNGDRLKDVFIMRNQHNMTFKQIGDEIGTKTDRARQVYLRSLRYLKKILQDYNIEENFADGKKKGKSRPGRVKRAGASCKGSVTSLRKKAAKYSGEKGKMYHWCANMKGGKKK